MDKKLIKNIAIATKTIRKKYKAIKAGIGERESILEDTFKSITVPLKSIAENKAPSTPPLPPKVEKRFMEEEEESEEDFKDAEQSTPKRRAFLSKSLPDFKQNSLSEKYLGYLLNESSLLDTIYGVRAEGTDSFRIGSSIFEFISDSNDFMIDKQLYRGTPGLYQLIFLKQPKAYSEDINEYKNILEQTNAYRRNYRPQAQINGSKSKKYSQIISKLIPKGKGLMKTPSSKYNHIYWNDPNELVSRLQLLHASQASGNNSHHNEIQSILEELREADIIH